MSPKKGVINMLEFLIWPIYLRQNKIYFNQKQILIELVVIR